MEETDMRSLWTMAAGAGGALLAAAPALADPRGDFGYWGHPMMGFGWIFGFLFMLLVIVLIVGAIVVVLRWLGIGGGGTGITGAAGPARPDPLDILEERLARGEISVEEYEERKRALGG
jgi:putative membrane protein